MQKSKHTGHVLALALGLALAGSSPLPAAISLSFSLTATTTTAIPSGVGSFTSFVPPDPITPSDPCISDRTVAFFGAGSGGQLGVYVKAPNDPCVPIADLNTAIAGGDGNFSGFLGGPFLSGLNAAFVGAGPGGQQGVYLKQPGDPIVPIADLNTLIAGGEGFFTAFSPFVSIDGTAVAFVGYGTGGQSGVYVKSPTDPCKVIADIHTAIPNGVGNFTFNPSDPCRLVNGRVAFIGQGDLGQIGVYLYPIDPTGQVGLRVADTSLTVPGTDGRSFGAFSAVAYDGTAVAFVGGTAFSLEPAPVSGVYKFQPGDPVHPQVVADTATAVPLGFGNFTGFGTVAVDPGVVVFEGFSLDANANPVQGLYTDLDGTLTKLLATGDTRGGKTVSALRFGPEGFSQGQVVFAAQFSDGSEAVAVATLSSGPCPLSQGYWKNTPGAWPLSALTLGSQTYSQSELLTLLKTSTSSDASLILARQLIAAKLSIAHASDPAPVNAVLADADARLSGFAGKLPYNVKPSSAAGQAMTADATVLNLYANGGLTLFCAP